MRTVILLFGVVLLAAACASLQPEQPAAAPSGTPAIARPATPTVTVAPGDRWAELLTLSPFPYATPLPPREPTPVDGTYIKNDTTSPEHIHCLRCPDFLPERGLWKLQLDRGVFRIYYAVSGWRSIASYAVSGDRLAVFNDPNCTDVTGTYRWQLSDGALTLQTLQDPCAIELRAANLSGMPWQSCQPPNSEAAVSGHWQVPEGCE